MQCWYWEGVGVGRAPVHHPVDHVLVLDAQDALAYQQALDPHTVLVQGDRCKLLGAHKLPLEPVGRPGEEAHRLWDLVGLPELAGDGPVVDRLMIS